MSQLAPNYPPTFMQPFDPSNTDDTIHQRFIISVGSKSKMFTLWSERWQKSTANTRGFYSRRYVRNLSMDFEEAVQKVIELTGVTREEIEIDRDETEEMIYGDDVLRFGKYDNHHISELDDVKYLTWLAKGANVSEMHQGEQIWKSILTEETQKYQYFAQDRLIALGAWVNYKGKNVSAQFADKLQKRDAVLDSAVRGHHYENGKRVKGAILRVIRISSYDKPAYSGYGMDTVFIATFISEDGKLLKYKGQSIFWERTKKMRCDFSIEHDEYKGEKETRIKRVKVLELIPYAEGEINPSTL